MADCDQCHVSRERTHRDAEGTAGEIHVRLHGVPLERCPRCGATHSPLDSRFALRFVIDMARSHNLRHAQAKGIFHPRYVCCQCGAALQDVPQPRTLKFTQVEGGEGLEVEITAPGHACFSCGVVQLAVGRANMNHLAEAFVAALERAAQPAG